MKDDVIPIRVALLSTSDKAGLVPLARALFDRGCRLLASGGTRQVLIAAGIDAVEVAEHTGAPEMLGGRVKTLHPSIHGGILARRDRPEDLRTLADRGIAPIDLVVVNLYPFEATAADPNASESDLIEQVDIGGPALMRAAAKNHAAVAVLSDPAQYPEFLAELDRHGGTTRALRRRLALDAWDRTARYDRAIVAKLSALERSDDDRDLFPERLELAFDRRQPLRQGENPHQRGAFYADRGREPIGLVAARQIHGKELSYNNLLDLDSALRLVRGLGGPAAAIIKHNNPCGAASAEAVSEAFELAYEGDPVSAFGGIVAINRAIDLATAERIGAPGRFVEAIVAPAFDADALHFLRTVPTWKASIRLLTAPVDQPTSSRLHFHRIEGGLLVQEPDTLQEDPAGAGDVPGLRPPTDAQRAALRFAWSVCQQVRSNAIVLARGQQVVGVGAGQMSRLDSVKIAIEKAGERARGAVLASDAFFPFRDGPDLALAAGVTAIIQPGGSRRDDETIAACAERDAAMIFTGRRHFRH